MRVLGWRLPAPAIVLALALAPALAVTPADAAPPRIRLEVFAAASLADAMRDLSAVFERDHPGTQVRIALAGSQQLAAQIEQGASADVFASADERWMNALEQRGWLADAPTVFARNRLVVILPRTNPARLHQLRDLARGGIKLVLGADAVPVGHYARIVLQNLARDPAFGPDFAARVLRNVVSEEENVRGVVAKVQLGEADAGIVYRSDVSPAVARYIQVLEIPDSANVLASYPVAPLRDARAAIEARAFIEFLLSDRGQQILANRGFIPVTGVR